MKWFTPSLEKEVQTKIVGLPYCAVDAEGFRTDKIGKPGIYCIEFPYGLYTRFIYIVVKAASNWFAGSERLYVELLMSQDYEEGRKPGEYVPDSVYKEVLLVSRLIRDEVSSPTWEEWGKVRRWVKIGVA
jgi:hypothetical protein